MNTETKSAIGVAEREVGRYVYKLIEARMDAAPGTPEGRELAYLAALVADVEEYGADRLSVDDLRAAGADEALIEYMAQRFLGWRLPEDFHPDCGIQFDADAAKKLNPRNSRYEPVGTNLFTATQAAAMVRHMLEGAPLSASAPPPSGEETTWRPISEIETRWADMPLYAIVCEGDAVGEAEFHGEDDGWWWANTYREYHSDRIYPTLFQPLPSPPTTRRLVEGGGE